MIHVKYIRFGLCQPSWTKTYNTISEDSPCDVTIGIVPRHNDPVTQNFVLYVCRRRSDLRKQQYAENSWFIQGQTFDCISLKFAGFSGFHLHLIKWNYIVKVNLSFITASAVMLHHEQLCLRKNISGHRAQIENNTKPCDSHARLDFLSPW